MDRRRNDRVVRHPGAERLARVIVSATGSEVDCRSIDALCRASAVGVAPGTFRAWCRAERLHAADVLAFTRVLRACLMARREHCDPEEFIDADYRTVRALRQRGSLEIDTLVGQSSEVFCRVPRFLPNTTVVDEVLRLLTAATDPARGR